MAWYDDIVDWGAEAIGYVDDFADFDATEYSAGQQLIDDASDTFGFIKQGAKAYGMLSGTLDSKGNRVKGKQQVFQQTQLHRVCNLQNKRNIKVNMVT